MQRAKMAGGILRQYVVFEEYDRTPKWWDFNKSTSLTSRQVLRSFQKSAVANRAALSTSCRSLIKWRYEQDVEPNPNRYGKLTNLPDYSFVNGRPVPLGMNLYRRMKLQETYCKRIVELSSEIDFALERHKKMVKESEMNRQKLIEFKLKEKGGRLLQKVKDSEK